MKNIYWKLINRTSLIYEVAQSFDSKLFVGNAVESIIKNMNDAGRVYLSERFAKQWQNYSRFYCHCCRHKVIRIIYCRQIFEGDILFLYEL